MRKCRNAVTSEEGKLIAVAATWIHPNAHTDGGHLIVVLQQLQALALTAVAVVEYHAPSLLTSEEAHVGTFHEVVVCLQELLQLLHFLLKLIRFETMAGTGNDMQAGARTIELLGTA